MAELWSQFVAEWPKLQGAWMSVVGIALAALVLGWLAGRFMYGQRVATLKDSIEDQKGRVQIRDDQIAAYKGAISEAGDAKALLREFEKRLAAAEGWRLSEQQLRSVFDAISGHAAGVTIIRSASSAKIETVHDQLVGVFREARWAVQEWPTLSAHSSDAPIELTTSPIMQTHVLDAIRKAFKDAGLPYVEREADGHEPSPVTIPQIWISSVPA